MAYKKKNLTPEERSAIYRANAAKRSVFRGGRKPKEGSETFVRPSSPIKIRKDDHDYVMELASEFGCSMSRTVHVVLYRYRLADRSMKSNGREWPVEKK